MEDIRADLHLMLEKPKFLQGMNMNQLPLGLQLGEITIPREEEIKSVTSRYQKCLSGYCEIVVVNGESGSGKSWLCLQVGSAIVADGGIFLMGKFEMHESKPFSALAMAFGQYISIVMADISSDWARMVVHSLQSTLGQDACHLVEILPSLGELLGVSVHDAAARGYYDCGNAVQRIHYLLCKFVDVMTATSQVSLTLCLDDLQWADEASTSVLNRVLAQSRNKFFFVGSCRGDQMKSEHPFWNMLVKINDNDVNVTTVSMTCLNENTLNGYISELLYLSPRLVKRLSNIIYRRTKGNILFISQLLLSLK